MHENLEIGIARVRCPILDNVVSQREDLALAYHEASIIRQRLAVSAVTDDHRMSQVTAKFVTLATGTGRGRFLQYYLLGLLHEVPIDQSAATAHRTAATHQLGVKVVLNAQKPDHAHLVETSLIGQSSNEPQQLPKLTANGVPR